MGLEILEQVPDLDAAVIPVGGGGLIAGVAKAIKTMKPGVKIIVRDNLRRLHEMKTQIRESCSI